MIKIITQYDLEYHIDEAEYELDNALNSGYSVIAVLQGWGGTADKRREGMIVLHKPYVDRYGGDDESMMQDYRDIQSERDAIRNEAGALDESLSTDEHISEFPPPEDMTDIPF